MYGKKYFKSLIFCILGTVIFISGLMFMKDTEGDSKPIMSDQHKIATFAGGCFWCMEPPFDQLDGVLSTTPGYIGGQVKDPTYEAVLTGTTGHAEAVQVVYDPTKVTYDQLLEAFWRNIDPTTEDQQFADVGTQYRTAIFYHDDEQKIAAEKSKEQLAQSGKFDNKLVTKIEPASEFYPAEDYHKDYYKKNPVRYNLYKQGSGRAGYIKKMWGSHE